MRRRPPAAPILALLFLIRMRPFPSNEAVAAFQLPPGVAAAHAGTAAPRPGGIPSPPGGIEAGNEGEGTIRKETTMYRAFRPAAPLLLCSLLLLASCAHAPAPGGTGGPPPGGDAAAAPAARPFSPPSDVASVPPHSGTIVYEAVQPDPSNMPRDVVLVLYADRKAVLLDRVIGDPGTPLSTLSGTWALSDAGSVRLYLEGKDGAELQLLLKRGEGYLTGDGSRFGGGILLLREI